MDNAIESNEGNNKQSYCEDDQHQNATNYAKELWRCATCEKNFANERLLNRHKVRSKKHTILKIGSNLETKNRNGTSHCKIDRTDHSNKDEIPLKRLKTKS